MYIYNYDETTKEYLNNTEADKDPIQSEIIGDFVPLIPANATLTEPPLFEENQIPVFENGEWIIKPDYRKNYYKVDDNFLVEEIETIGEQEGYYIVDKETGDLIKENPDKYKIVDNQIVAKTEEEYQQEQAQKEAERLAMLNLTRGDVFRGLLLAKGITKTQIAQMIETMPVSTQEEIVTKELALIDFEDALNFYRGNQLIDTIGLALGITSKQLDKFFDVGNSDDKANAYMYLTNVTFTIDPVPESAEVTINGEVTETVTVPYGNTVEYTVTAEGYLPQSGSMELFNDTTIDVELFPEPTEDTGDGEDNSEVETSEGEETNGAGEAVVEVEDEEVSGDN